MQIWDLFMGFIHETKTLPLYSKLHHKLKDKINVAFSLFGEIRKVVEWSSSSFEIRSITFTRPLFRSNSPLND